MTDMFTRKKRSSIMAGIRGKGNRTTELRFIRMMRKYEIRGWRRGSKLFGRPDFVFSAAKLAVFIDGDFWHGNPKKFRLPKSNLAYWQGKISSNRKRDKLVGQTLESLGWTVARFWESSLRDEEAIAAALKMKLLVLRDRTADRLSPALGKRFSRASKKRKSSGGRGRAR